tara:strand:- start:275 stop:430 length:156 start_codon:yes stop_codon:yes gene_type:complete
MTEIEQKVQVVRQYIFNRKGVDIVDIKLVDGTDLQKLDYAYNYIMNNQHKD